MKVLLLIACAVYAVQGFWVDEMENDGLFQGDMILDPGQQAEAMDGKFTFGSVRTGLWTKRGDSVTIPYTMDRTIGGSAKAKRALQAAFADYHKFTCLRFVPRRNNERAYIHFKTGGGCSSPVGMTGRQNTVTLASGCWSRSTVIHEIGHSIGLHHEQSRPDRDSFIKVRWENIPNHIEYNFKKQSTDRVDSRGTPYDYRSVMHYGKTAFGGGKVTMQAINTYFTDLIGVGAGFSDVDVEQINKMYSCPKYNGVVEPVKQTPDCHDSTSYCEMQVWNGGCGGWNARRCPFLCKKCTPGGGPVPTNAPPTKAPCTNYHKRCQEWANRGECKKNPNYMLRWCPLSCKVCSA